MVKLGDEYQEIVGLVREALDPDAAVKVGQWIEGPDGRRDMDVEVRGTVEGKEQFILVECKDWKKKVGIETIDALESKRHDLVADHAVIYSNSGFSQPALRKARRVGIQAFSALREKDKKIRVSVFKKLVVKALSVDTYSIRVFFNKESESEIPKEWTPIDIFYSDCPLVNWLSNESKDLLSGIDVSKNIISTYAFKGERQFKIRDKAVKLTGIEMSLKCGQKWLSQEVQAGVTLGHYDHLKKTISIPDKEAYFFGPVDQEKWEEIEEGWDESQELEPNSFMMRMTLMRPIANKETECTPDIESIVADKQVRYEEV
ncbi:MAG: restriction endonuclease, partial [Methylobacter sp.]